MNRNTFKRPGLTLVVATTLLFTGPIAAYAAVGEADNATNNADNTAAVSTSADGNNGIIKTEPGTSSATGGDHQDRDQRSLRRQVLRQHSA